MVNCDRVIENYVRVAEEAVWGESDGMIQRSNLFNETDMFRCLQTLFGSKSSQPCRMYVMRAAVMISACLPGDRTMGGGLSKDERGRMLEITLTDNDSLGSRMTRDGHHRRIAWIHKRFF